MSSVGRVLNTTELLHKVMESLAASHPSVLPGVARVARFFTNPALDALWRIIPSSIDLLKLLPSFELVDECHYVSVDRVDHPSPVFI